jgi:hypothetical protein
VRDELLKDLDAATRAGDMELARAIDAKLSAAPENAAEGPKSVTSKLMDTWQLRGLANLTGGALRGSASIGSTLLAPFGMDRREDVTAGLKTAGFDTDSGAFGAGKLGAEIAGTSGVGKLLGLGAKAFGAAPSVVNALTTSGFRTGGAKSVADMATRIGAGGAVGGVTAGLVNPEDADTGAAIGAALPPAMKIAGTVGNAIGSKLAGPVPPASVQAAAKAGLDDGYVIPPSQVRPTVANRLMEGLAGKISTAQNASARNQAITNQKAAADLGLNPDTQITKPILNAIRSNAGQAYEAVSTTGLVSPGKPYDDALDAIVAPFKKAASGFPNAKPSPVIDEIESLRTDSFDASAAVEKVKELRDSADSAFTSGNKGAGRAYKAAAKALEDALDAHMVAIGAPADLLQNFRESRQLIAKTYTVEKALNPTTGTVDAGRLAADLKKGRPLSGGLKSAAEFAQAFPKAAQTTERMGSLPQMSPLDWMAGAAVSGATQSPLGMLGLLARPAARSAALSGRVQRGLLGGGGVVNPELEALLYRSAPLLAGDR